MAITEKPRISATINPISPQPAPPVRQFSFTDFQVNNPSAPLPADRLDGEIDRSNKAISDTLAWASVSLNSDGSLKPHSVGRAQLQAGLFDHLETDALSRLLPLVTEAQSAATRAVNAASEADELALATSHQYGLAFDAAEKASTDADDAAASAAAAAQSALEADASANDAANSANHADGSEAVCQDYADVTMAWAEHMPDIIPPNILAVMGVTGDHWSSRWWASRALQIVNEGSLITISDTPPVSRVPGSVWWNSADSVDGGGNLYLWYEDASSGQWVPASNQPGPAGPEGPPGPQGPPGSGSVAGMTAGQIPIAASATGIASSANLSGDVSSNAALVATLATVNPNVGSFQGLTLDAKGRVTAAINQNYLPAATAVATYAPINAPVFAGTVTAAQTVSTGQGVSTADCGIEIGGNRTGNGNAFLDLHAQGSSDYDLRIFRTSGANGGGQIANAGTGGLFFYSNGNSSLQIDSAGHVGIGVAPATSLHVNGDVTANFVLAAGYQARAGTAGPATSNMFNFQWIGAPRLWVDGVDLGQITVTCDYRIKDNIAALPSTWDKVKALRPVSYTIKENLELLTRTSPDEHWGFLAHELQETLLPSAATGVKDAPNLVQSPDLMALIAPLTRALQEAMQRIETLEAALAASP